MLELNLPPDIRTLMQDPSFKKMMRTRPKMPDCLTSDSLPPAWHVWVWTTDERWKRGRYRTYDEAYRKMREQLELETVADVSVVSIRRFFVPPQGFKFQPRKFPWCARCRRPSTFLEQEFHRALGRAETTLDEPFRCFYCGIRRVALPTHSPR